MSEPYIGEVKMFAGNFAPYGYSLCLGQLLPIPQNSALFSLLGANYGGDGRTTFGLPNLAGRAPVNQGTANTGQIYLVGEAGGQEQSTLLQSNMPTHTHKIAGTTAAGVTSVPGPTTFLATATDAAGTPLNIYGSAAPDTEMLPSLLGVTGGSQPFPVRNPYVTISFIIALSGEWPVHP
ncbi:phage tail protein [Pantoea sp. Tr-811]|uniref:phage tail protein n=1 Tax=Pantoea sp. Tr-811 TaxID=2608361 RepID=UPI0014206A03|nr:tail fiber protein [Pantoea sp. Tr-811]NIF30164.1 phage tail protein [Pantoea sp. Tr-811]